MIEIYAVNIKEKLSKDIYKQYFKIIDKEKKCRIFKFKNINDIKRTLIADILVRFIICNKLNIKNSGIFFCRNKYGKPYLKYPKGIDFSVSHSGEWVVCAIHVQPIGIDIEEIISINCAIAAKHFSKKEISLLKKYDYKNINLFYDLWTLKESYTKFIGKGLLLRFNSFSVILNKYNIKIENSLGISECFFKQYYIDNNYKLSVCASKNEFPDKVIIEKISKVNLFSSILKIDK